MVAGNRTFAFPVTMRSSLSVTYQHGSDDHTIDASDCPWYRFRELKEVGSEYQWVVSATFRMAAYGSGCEADHAALPAPTLFPTFWMLTNEINERVP